MAAKTGSWIVISALAMVVSWAAPAEATERAVCEEEYAICMDRASAEPVDWIRDYSEQRCEQDFNVCLGPWQCGDNICNENYWESELCPADCQ